MVSFSPNCCHSLVATISLASQNNKEIEPSPAPAGTNDMAAKIATWMKRRRVVKVGSPAVLVARPRQHLWRRRCLSREMFCDGGCSTFGAGMSICVCVGDEDSITEGQNDTRRTIFRL
mmetsp:Transcript_737/g.2065  ORF Transcript_737/g.2065 Transcript_737/m.2065 type:complete len:118 (-) Transcript_737:32-385(-)